jgi:hypothetical protein
VGRDVVGVWGCEAGRLREVEGGLGSPGEGPYLVDEILAQVAAYAAVGQLNQFLLALDQFCALDDALVDVDFGHVVDEDRASAVRFF